MLICIQHHQASVTRARPVGRRECTANYHRNEQARRRHFLIFWPFPFSRPAAPAPAVVLSFHPRDRPGRAGPWGSREDAVCPLCGSTGQGTVRGARLRVRPRLCTCVGRRAGSQRVCNACGCKPACTVREAGVSLWASACATRMPACTCRCGSATSEVVYVWGAGLRGVCIGVNGAVRMHVTSAYLSVCVWLGLGASACGLPSGLGLVAH